jgi:hypothetical protein
MRISLESLRERLRSEDGSKRGGLALRERLRGGEAGRRQRLVGRLENERPSPQGPFAHELRGEIGQRWTLVGRPAAWRWLTAAALAGGVALLVVALVVARG